MKFAEIVLGSLKLTSSIIQRLKSPEFFQNCIKNVAHFIFIVHVSNSTGGKGSHFRSRRYLSQAMLPCIVSAGSFTLKPERNKVEEPSTCRHSQLIASDTQQ